MKDANEMTLQHNPIEENKQSEIDKKYYKDFIEGNQKAFESLVIEHKDHLIFFINRYVKDISVSEDLAQDAFVEILVHKERYDYKVSFKTYLFTIGRNKAIDYIRKNQRITFVDEYIEESDDEQNLEKTVIKNDEVSLLYRKMKELKEDYQAVISLIDLEGMSYTQAGKVLQKSESQIKILVYRARKSLAKLMEREGFLYEE